MVNLIMQTYKLILTRPIGGDKKEVVTMCNNLLSDSYRIQTCNLLIRSQMLYSVELRSQKTLSLFQCDSYRIQTCNLLIRSQMLYSVELRSLPWFAVAKVSNISVISKTFGIKMCCGL